MPVPGDLKYTRDHEWLRLEGDQAIIGITDFAQSQLGDVVFVELPAVGAQVTKGAAFGVVESVKAVSDLYAPVSGAVTAVNAALPDAPATVNQDPYGQAWMIKVKIANPAEIDELLPAAQYGELIAQGH